MLRIGMVACLALILGAEPGIAADKVPTRVGQCVQTTIAQLTSRLEGVPDSGDAIVYGNDIYGVDYGTVEGMKGARVGDRIKLCLTALPKDCPPGDERGKVYRATDARTHKSWELPDAEHMCGGA